MTNKAKKKYVHIPVKMEEEGKGKIFNEHLLFSRHPSINTPYCRWTVAQTELVFHTASHCITDIHFPSSVKKHDYGLHMLHFKVLYKLFRMAARWANKLYWVLLGQQSILSWSCGNTKSCRTNKGPLAGPSPTPSTVLLSLHSLPLRDVLLCPGGGMASVTYMVPTLLA